MELLVKGAAELDLHLTPRQVESFRVYHRELAAWNHRMNLTAIVDSDGAQVRHFVDSLTVAKVIPDAVKDHGRMLDVGAGAGFPGVPLKLMFPGMHLSMLDSVGKKTSFLEHLVEILELEDVDVYNGRAEDLAMRPELRESFDVVVSRGVARMRVLMEYTLPYCRVGGIVVTLKKGGIAPEVSDALHAMDVLAGRIREMRGVTVDGLDDGRALVVVEKVKATPAKFPRRPGLPAKRPL